MINIPYGKMMTVTFSLVESINNPPDFKEDKWFTDSSGFMHLQVFPKYRSKISDGFGSGFIEVTNPSFIIYLVNFFLNKKYSFPGFSSFQSSSSQNSYSSA